MRARCTITNTAVLVATLRVVSGAALAVATPLSLGAQQNSLTAAIEAYEARRTDEARRSLEPLLDGPSEPTARAYLGRINFDLGEWDAAEEQLERAVELEPQNAEFRYWLAISYLEHINHVSIFRKRGMANKARDTLIRTLEIDPDHMDARMTLAGYYLDAPGIVGGSKDKAREQLQEIIARDPVRGRLFEAQIYEDDGDWAAAETAYTDVIAAAPDNAHVLYQAGMFRQGRSQWPEAVDLFERAAYIPETRDNREFVRAALYQLGRTGVLSGENVDRSIAALVEFTERYPDPEDALGAGARWRLGMLFEMNDDPEAARAAYRAALTIDPDHEEAKRALKNLGG